MVPVFMNVGDRYTAKNYHPVSLLYVVCRVFGKLVTNRLVDNVEKWDLIPDFSDMFLGHLGQLQIL